MPGASIVKQEISKAFKLHGYQLRVEASRYLETLLTPIQDRSAWIEKILDQLSQKDLASAVLDKIVLEKVIKECSNQVAGDSTENVFNVIDAFQIPLLTYSTDRKKFFLDSSLALPKPKLFADANSKARIGLARYEMLQQRTARHKLFSTNNAISTLSNENDGSSGAANIDADKKYALKTVDFLLGTNTRIENVIVLGMITMLKQGTYSLEDPTGSLALDLTEAKFHKGLYTENCFVLVEGWYEDRIFHVVAMGHPPIESSEVTRSYFGSLNFFGGPSETCPKTDPRIVQLEAEDDSAMLVFLSDVWLDKPEVLTRLKRLFVGYSAMPPTAFILMGNFMASTTESGPQKTRRLKELFKNLADVIGEHKDLISQSKFIFIPGPNDPGHANIYPRPCIPDYICSDLKDKLPNICMASNPCRIQMYTQEIVVFREDIISKMCRNCIYFPEDGSDTNSHFSRTILSQGHLAPLPLANCPVHWDYDRSLWLYPLPDLVVIGDKLDHFTNEPINGCSVVNPGSFGKNDFSFKTYVPKLKLVEDSQVPAEDYA